jgi:hypothetical protein
MLKKVASMLDGYKTVIGGFGFLLLGVVGAISNLFPDLGLPESNLEMVMTNFSLGFAALGLGGKAEKLIKTNKEKVQ